MKYYSSYMSKVYKDPKAFRNKVFHCADSIAEIRMLSKFDAIAFRGTSGAAMAFPISALMGIPLICVRKEDGHHSSTTVEGPSTIDIKQYMILDDFISGGGTVREIVSKISSITSSPYGEASGPPKCVGIMLWNDEHYFWPEKTSYIVGEPEYEVPIYKL